MADTGTIRNHAAFIWSVADLLRGDYKQSEYGKVILPLTVLRRLDCVLAPTKQQVLDRYAQLAGKVENIEPVLQRTSGEQFFNTSKYDFGKLLDAPDDLADNLRHYIASFSAGARDVLVKFDFDTQIGRLDRSNLLYLVVSRFADIDLHPDKVSNLEMGYLYEELIRRFSELSNETAGEHFTPREVIRLMVNLLFIEDEDLLTKPGIVKTMLDPACGTGGMLSVAEDHLRALNPAARLQVFGQELNAETFAVCRSDMMLKGQDATNIVYGNCFSEDGHPRGHYDYLLANPPFGVEWKKVADVVRDEAESKGFAGRFGAGLPRINDGSFLFLQHMISKMKPVEQGGSRVAIVFNGSPLLTGAAGSGESEIRRWIIENDWLEAVVALPDQLFYNTGISTYFWIVTNRKGPTRRGKVQLVDAREFFVKMRKSLGEKRKEMSATQIDEVVRLYGDFAEGDKVKIFPNESFGFVRITIERPLRVRWEFNDDTLAAVEADARVTKMDETARATLLALLRTHVPTVHADYSAVAKLVRLALRDSGLKGGPLESAVLGALAVRDPDARPLVDGKGDVEPDPGLRDTEDVPLPDQQMTFEADVTSRLAMSTYRTAIDEYVKTEVRPFVSDAWASSNGRRIGYGIDFRRAFFRRSELPSEDAAVRSLEESGARLHEASALVPRRFDASGPVRSIRAKYLFTERIERGADAPLGSVISGEGVVLRSEDDSVWNPAGDVDQYKLVEVGDFVIGLRSFQHGLVRSSVRALVSPAYTVLVPTVRLISYDFYEHLFESRDFVSALETISSGIRQGRTISFSDFGELQLPHPADPVISDLTIELERIRASRRDLRLYYDVAEKALISLRDRLAGLTVDNLLP